MSNGTIGFVLFSRRAHAAFFPPCFSAPIPRVVAGAKRGSRTVFQHSAMYVASARIAMRIFLSQKSGFRRKFMSISSPQEINRHATMGQGRF